MKVPTLRNTNCKLSRSSVAYHLNQLTIAESVTKRVETEQNAEYLSLSAAIDSRCILSYLCW